MKRYLWTAVAVLFINANASENPFALKENLLVIDNDQEMLLSELSKIAEERKDSNLEENEQKFKAKVVEIEESKEVLPEEESIKMEDSEEQYNLTKSIDELLGNTDKDESFNSAAALKEEETIKKAKELTLKVAKAEEAQAKALKEKEEEQKKAAKVAEKKATQEKMQKEAKEKLRQVEKVREEERREVLVYEKERAEKLAKKEDEPAREKSKKAQEKPVEQVKMKTIETVESKMVVKVEISEGDIDIEAEQRAKKEIADTAYLEAVREMDQED